MSDENSSGGESAPESPQVLNTAPDAVHTESDAPAWIKEAGLEQVHKDTAAPKPATPPAARVTPHTKGPASATPPSGEQPAPGFTPAAPQGQPQQQQPVPGAFDSEALSRSIVSGLREGLRPEAPAAPRMSPAEVAQKLNIFTATPEVYEAILGVKPERPEQVAALNAALQGVAKQAVTIADALMQTKMDALQAQFNPYMQVIQQQEASKQQDAFYREAPELTGYKKLVESTFRNMQAAGAKFPNIETARKALADETKRLLAESGIKLPAPVPGQRPVSPRTTAAPTRTMSPVSTGGRSGGSGSPAAPDKMKAIWG